MQTTNNKPQITNWLVSELDVIEANQPKMDRLPSLQMEENKIAEIDIDFSQPFDNWQDKDGNTKKMIVCTHAGIKKLFWLNVKNPLYREILVKAKQGQTKFKILRTGQAKATRYTIIEG